MKSLNAIELVELLRRHGPISRAGLAKVSRLSKPTVSIQVDALLAKGLVVEVGMGEGSARGGKKPTLLKFNADFGRILCVDVGPEWVRFAIADLMGARLRARKFATHPEQGAEAVLRTIEQGISELLAEESGACKLQLISAAVPGIVDVRKGVVLETDNVFGWRQFEFARKLQARFGIPVHVDNDVNMAALAELNSQDHVSRNFVLMRLSTGIGAGVVLGGALHQGAHWAAGEIGHMLLKREAAAGQAIPRGYLESVVGSDRVEWKIGKLAGSGNANGLEGDAWSQLSATLKRGQGPLMEMVEDLVFHLGGAVTNIAAVYDPEEIILLGEPFAILLEPIRDFARRWLPWPLRIRLSTLGEDASLKGALAAGLSRAYEQIAIVLRNEGLGADTEFAAAGTMAVASTPVHPQRGTGITV
ncbi:MAG TPA: ROK family transcriptional regulator [Bryobacteraceae bacterium]|nr:ROK family transcriptional regulator [Bryobacteraceae bacterium]